MLSYEAVIHKRQIFEGKYFLNVQFFKPLNIAVCENCFLGKVCSTQILECCGKQLCSGFLHPYKLQLTPSSLCPQSPFHHVLQALVWSQQAKCEVQQKVPRTLQGGRDKASTSFLTCCRFQGRAGMIGFSAVSLLTSAH